jgi:uncharacterized protein (TIGR02145 family)
VLLQSGNNKGESILKIHDVKRFKLPQLSQAMKAKNILLALSLVLASSLASHAQVGIGTSSPNAALDVSSTSNGFLPPRMTYAQRNAIATPAQGLMIYCTNCGANGEAQLYNGTAWVNLVGGAAADTFVCGDNVTFTYNGSSVTYGTVSRAYGGTIGTKCWLDRNLGAIQVATSSNDAASYGDLFQWGRGADGHQIRTSLTTPTLSSADQPGNGHFITSNSSPNDDWRSPQNANLWQGVYGVNNPCPSGYRIPTVEEWEAEFYSWILASSYNAAGAFASPLKLPLAGDRNCSDGSLRNGGDYGSYWSSWFRGTSSSSSALYFESNSAGVGHDSRANGYSVRCIKN